MADHRLRWLATGSEGYATMEQAIHDAQHCVCLESYMVRPQGPAARLLPALVAAARRGVRVRVLVDAYGAEELPEEFFAPLQAVGGHARRFNPRRLLRLSARNHRKLLVVDDSMAIVGGFNIAPEYEGDGVTSGWRDLGLQVQGPVVEQLTASFDAMWLLAPFTPADLRGFHAARARQPGPDGPVAVLTSGPGCPRAVLRRSMRRDLVRARDVLIMAAYFVPSTRIRRALLRCAQRGGRVRLLLAGRTDVEIVRWATLHLVPRLDHERIQIHEYLPQVLHAKLLVLDNVIHVGSCNLDRRSLHVNYELLLRIESPELARDAREMFEADLRHARPARRRLVVPAWEGLLARLAYLIVARIDPVVALGKLKWLA